MAFQLYCDTCKTEKWKFKHDHTLVWFLWVRTVSQWVNLQALCMIFMYVILLKTTVNTAALTWKPLILVILCSFKGLETWINLRLIKSLWDTLDKPQHACPLNWKQASFFICCTSFFFLCPIFVKGLDLTHCDFFSFVSADVMLKTFL